MALRMVLNEQDPILRKRSREVTDFNPRLWQLLDDMAETMYQEDGAGLAAVQVGVLRRAVVVDVGEGLIELVNPRIVDTRGAVEDSEGCLSSPGEYGLVVRPQWVKVQAQDRNGNAFEIEGEDLLARAFCHEIDHLEGVLFKDRMTHLLTREELRRRRRR